LGIYLLDRSYGDQDTIERLILILDSDRHDPFVHGIHMFHLHQMRCYLEV